MADEVSKYVAPEEVEGIINNHVLGAVGLGFVPVPLVDVLGLMGIQLDMIKKLADCYEVPFKESLAKNVIGTLVGSITPVALTPFAFSLLKIIPVVGYTASAVSLCIMGGGATYALGRIFAKHFANGGKIDDLKIEDVKQDFVDAYEEGKKLAKDTAASFQKKNEEKAAPAAEETAAEAPAAHAPSEKKGSAAKA